MIRIEGANERIVSRKIICSDTAASGQCALQEVSTITFQYTHRTLLNAVEIGVSHQTNAHGTPPFNRRSGIVRHGLEEPAPR